MAVSGTSHSHSFVRSSFALGISFFFFPFNVLKATERSPKEKHSLGIGKIFETCFPTNIYKKTIFIPSRESTLTLYVLIYYFMHKNQYFRSGIFSLFTMHFLTFFTSPSSSGPHAIIFLVIHTPTLSTRSSSICGQSWKGESKANAFFNIYTTCSTLLASVVRLNCFR